MIAMILVLMWLVEVGQGYGHVYVGPSDQYYKSRANAWVENQWGGVVTRSEVVDAVAYGLDRPIVIFKENLYEGKEELVATAITKFDIDYEIQWQKVFMNNMPTDGFVIDHSLEFLYNIFSCW